LVALFLDATFIAVRPDGPKEGVQVAWELTEDGERVLLSVALGMRESFEDWQTLSRDLIAHGLGAPMLIVADGAPGLTKAIEQCRPASDRQRCCVHRARNLYAKVPDREHERVKHAYWQALHEAISETDAKRRLQALADQLDTEGFTAATRCLADDLDALVTLGSYCRGAASRLEQPWNGYGETSGGGCTTFRASSAISGIGGNSASRSGLPSVAPGSECDSPDLEFSEHPDHRVGESETRPTANR
jgi:hypothetical protein